MPAKKKPSTNANIARLRVLGEGDEGPFREVVLELLTSSDRLGREAALEALRERPLHGLRAQLRAAYADADDGGDKHDPGGRIRAGITLLLATEGDARDADIGLRAAETREQSMGVDGTANLRAAGLRLLAAAAPDIFPFVAAEHVNDSSTFSPEPAQTALQLLAGTGHELAVYQWLVTRTEPEPALVEVAVELLAGAPAAIMARCLSALARDALAGPDEPLLTKIAEAIVERDLESAYPALSLILRGAISKELHAYLALLLARTNRPPLLSMLEALLRDDIRRRAGIIDALRVRPTPEQAEILARWEEEHG